MEQSKVTILNANDRRRFRSCIEGCIPDLIDLSSREGLYRDPDETDRDSIYDYAADRASDLFPMIDEEERRQLVNWVVDDFCGKQEADPNHEDAFPISALFPKQGGV